MFVVAVILREAEALREVLAHDVAVEPVDEDAALLELGATSPAIVDLPAAERPVSQIT